MMNFKGINISKKETKVASTERKVTEVKVDGKTVKLAMNTWNIVLNCIGGVFAIIGAFSLVQPDLRMEIVTVFSQFIDEIGLFF